MSSNTPDNAGKRKSGWIVLVVLALLLAVSIVISFNIGFAEISPREIFQVIRAHLTGTHAPLNSGVDNIIWNLRFPRIALALLVGAGLAVAGALMQSLFHNPMADPYVVGVSSGAALGAVIAVPLGLSFVWLGLNATSLTAFLGALIVTFLVYGMARRGRRVPVGTLLLTGIAIGSLMQAVTAFLLLIRNQNELREVFVWLMGSLGNARWEQVGVLLPYALIGIAISVIWRRELNILALGDETAHHLGVNTERTRLLLLVLASLLAAASVAMCGVIAFVGLIIPHLMRLLVGSNHRILLPACVLGGGLLLLWADVIARTIIPGGELPIGVVTSALGSPFFLYLLQRHRGQGF